MTAQDLRQDMNSDKSKDDIIHRLSLEYSPPPLNGKPKWAVQLDDWMVNDGN